MSVSDLARHSSSRVVIEHYDEIGYNYRMTDLQAALGLVQLQRLDKMLGRRRELAERYSRRLSTLGWLVTPCEPADCRHNFQSYMMRLTGDAPLTRDALMQELLDHGVSHGGASWRFTGSFLTTTQQRTPACRRQTWRPTRR